MRQLIDRIFTRRCVLCGLVGSATGICDLCLDILPLNDNCCAVCGQPLETQSPVDIPCGACQVRRPVFGCAGAPFLYEFPVDAALKKLKFRRRLAFAPPFARLLAPMVGESFPDSDVLVPVPLNRWRQARRGFNQADELCRPLSRHTGLPIFYKAKRRRATAPQSGLSAAARKRNVRGAFLVGNLAPYRHPLIVDDVMTTGATCNELARALFAAGAESVGAIAVARASGR